MIRAKFKCESVKTESWGEQVSFRAVYSEDKTSENYTWSQYTPNGQLTMTITNPAAQGKFVVGQEYYLDISPAPLPQN